MSDTETVDTEFVDLPIAPLTVESAPALVLAFSAAAYEFFTALIRLEDTETLRAIEPCLNEAAGAIIAGTQRMLPFMKAGARRKFIAKLLEHYCPICYQPKDADGVMFASDRVCDCPVKH